MDFYIPVMKENKDGTLQLRPDWRVGRSNDLMTRGSSFYAIWDEAAGLWSTDIYDVQRLVDREMEAERDRLAEETGRTVYVDRMQSSRTKLWDDFQRYLRNSSDGYHELDESLVFAGEPVEKDGYSSKRLPYALEPTSIDAWDTLVSTLYSEEERAKIEWAIGSVIAGDSRRIQKFLVFYGPPGSGKSTILNIIEMLFAGYTAVFDARALGSANNSFATAAFKSNPLVAIQHDGDLSRIHDNTKLNSIVSHEVMPVEEKYKAAYGMRVNAFLFMGTNVPVKISDAKSGIIRRLIDVVPTQQTVETDTYHALMDRIPFELGGIAWHCLNRYRAMGRNYYSTYRPTEMMLQTDIFYNFVEYNFDLFKAEDGVSLKRAWELYKAYCIETGIEKMLPQYKLREELKNYFFEFHDRFTVGDRQVRSYYAGFKHLAAPNPVVDLPVKVDDTSISLNQGPSLFDELYSGMPAQYAKDDGTPAAYWDSVTTTLADLDTSRLHYVRVPTNHIVVDFDLRGADGEKSLDVCLEAAAHWPPTYSEVSRSGGGLHLHYDFTGDVSTLASIYSPGIEIKTFPGHSSLRRQLTLCTHTNVTPISGGLPTKEKPVITDQTIKSERGLRRLIARNLVKDIHPATKPSVDFIHKVLEEAFEGGVVYDVTDMRRDIMAFAANSSNQAEACLALVNTMHFSSEDRDEVVVEADDGPIVFYDVEVYPNLFVVCWKEQGNDTVVRMINPTSTEIEPLFGKKLVGFNNRRYDNHILYARYLGYSNAELHKLSQSIIDNDREAMLGPAYGLSYADIYDFSSKKQSLKRFQHELGIHHSEMDIPWDEDAPEDRWADIVEYCVNDVVSTEAVFEYRQSDFTARLMLAKLSGLSANHSTQQHTARIIFNGDKDASKAFVYTDLSGEFPGYVFDGKSSLYRGVVPGEGGYVYALPGIHRDCVSLDVASMHPTSIERLNLFGPYTQRFSDLKKARMAIKHRKLGELETLLDGNLSEFVGGSDEDLEALSYALKIVINIVYGLTSASFPNAFRDNRNVDNIVAKRGALFMIDLMHAVEEQGFPVAHIKTDSIKIPNATQEIIDFVIEFGKRYGYDFEVEARYDVMCLANDAVYIARENGKWTAVGAQFQQPYTFKTLFSGEQVEFEDLCEQRSVSKGSMYLEFTEGGERVHVGRNGVFVPVLDGGATLIRNHNDKDYAVANTKGYSWITRDSAKARAATDSLNVDMSFFETAAAKAKEAIEVYPPYSFDEFVNENTGE